MKVPVETERGSEANAHSAPPAGAPMPWGDRFFPPNGMAGPRGGPARFAAFGVERVESSAPDAVVSCLSSTGGRLRCNQIISQRCSEFQAIV